MGNGADTAATFGHYRILRLLGTGRRASVFEAVPDHAGPNARPLALKIFMGAARDDVDLAPAAAVEHGIPGAAVRHPALVPLLEVGRVGDSLFATMELVPGPSLAHLLRAIRRLDLPMDEHVVRVLALQLADGLRALHVASVDGAPLGAVHGDLRPANVLLDPSGQARITDIGVVGLLRAWSAVGPSEHSLDPPLYLAPELLDGDAPNTASDVFSWGAIVLELILGRPVFATSTEKGSVQKLRKLAIEGQLRTAAGAMPELTALVETALHLHPADRFPDGNRLMEALEPLAPPATARELLSVLVQETAGMEDEEPSLSEDAEEIAGRLSGEGEERAVRSFALPASDPVPASEISQEVGAEGPPVATDDLSVTDDIGETEELAAALETSSMETRQTPGSDAAAGARTDPAADEPSADEPSADERSEEGSDELEQTADDDDTTGDEEGLRTDEMPSRPAPEPSKLPANLEISAFNPPPTQDDELERTLPPGRKGGEASGDDEEPTGGDEPGTPAADRGRAASGIPGGRAAAKPPPGRKKPETVTVWTGTSGRPERVRTGTFRGEERPPRKWPWIVLSVAAVGLLGMLLISEFLPSDEDRGKAPGEGSTTTSHGLAGSAGGDSGAAVDAHPRGGDQGTGSDTGAGEPATAEPTTADGGDALGELVEEPVTEVPILDPSILDPGLPPVDERDDGTADAGGDGTAAEETPAPAAPPEIRHSPASRGIRGRDIGLTATVDPPGSYRVTVWYRSVPDGVWQTTQSQAGANGSLSLSIPSGPWLGNEAKEAEYFIEVSGPGGLARAGSAAAPFRIQIF